MAKTAIQYALPVMKFDKLIVVIVGILTGMLLAPIFVWAAAAGVFLLLGVLYFYNERWGIEFISALWGYEAVVVLLALLVSYRTH